ncbi:MAG: ATP-binding protein [Gammaproteobacteria bacterium]|nr:ATP-binding protein [Gammaproteobacteria bacterium]
MAAAYALVEMRSIREGMADEYSRMAVMIAASSRAAVAFSDTDFAQRLVEGAMSGPDIEGVVIIGALGDLLGGSLPDGTTAQQIERYLNLGVATEFAPDAMVAIAPVELDGEVIGRVVVLAGYAALESAQAQLRLIVAGGLLLALIMAYLISLPLERRLTRPIVGLAAEMASLSKDKDYSRRVAVTAEDEIGELYRRFNEMLGEIDTRDRHIDGERSRLEEEVAARTTDLRAINSELEQHVEDLRLAGEAAREAARSKAEFLANMSHEIRTPMNGVLGMLELVRDSRLGSEQRDFVETAYHSGQGLLTLIDDILDLSKIEAGKMEIATVPVSPGELVEEVCSILYQQAQARENDLVTILQPEFHDRHVLDPTRVRQILVNLVGNAIKFTHGGSVVIEGRVTHGDGQSRLHVDVADTGIGISPEAQEQLFEAFTQADGSTTRKYGGTGLGLTITRQLIELMKGEIAVHSVPERGSTFSFSLPIGTVAQSTPAPRLAELRNTPVAVCIGSSALQRSVTSMLERALAGGALVEPERAAVLITDDPGYRAVAAERVLVIADRHDSVASGGHRLPKPLRFNQLVTALLGGEEEGDRRGTRDDEVLPSYSGARVLLAEDNQVNQLVATRMLARFGIRCDVANDGAEVLDHLKSADYDLVLMDCQMPQVDGYQATAEIRRMEAESAGQRTPIVALTANAMEGDAERCLDAGMDDYLAKPMESAKLRGALARWLTLDA